MTKEERIKDFQDTYDYLTNPEKREERKRKEEVKKRLEDKKKDSGYE